MHQQTIRGVWAGGLGALLLLTACGGGSESGSEASPPVATPTTAPTTAPTTQPTVTPSSTPAPDTTPTVSPSMAPTPTPAPASDAQSFYQQNIEPAVVQSRCIQCHVAGGLAKNTRLIFTADSNNNYAQFDEFTRNVASGKDIILNKVRGGDSHGGGSIFNSGSAEYQDLQTFLGLLTESDTETPSSNESLFKNIQLASGEKTLRRATLLLAGRGPSASEYQQAATEDGLRTAIRNLMEGPGFHEFLIRGANDKLFFDAFFNGLYLEQLDGQWLERVANKRYNAMGGTTDEFRFWEYAFTFGIARSPLELIAYVVENDRPYTEILTADYMMLNPQSAEVLNPQIQFPDDRPNQFLPGTHRGQIVLDQQYSEQCDSTAGCYVLSHSGYLEYPHAGLLNEPAFLNRYPTTETNRNRARARWTYLHFLGVDIEKSAARTTDPVALADTDNPTMNNPNCTVCHSLLDPVAGAFQNYGNTGFYRDSWGGKDSLPETYKEAEENLYRLGDTWFRDMRTPGLEGQTAPNAQTSVRWLGQQIVQDPRFATATVRFWWPALMSGDLIDAPENSSDANFAAQLRSYEEQQSTIEALANGFRSGFAGGPAYNLKDLLREMVLSPWFRAERGSSPLDEAQQVGLTKAGVARLLTPEELHNKTLSLLGSTWAEWPNEYDLEDGSYSALKDAYGLYYGGIDSAGVKARATETNTVMTNVALAQALGMACETVIFDFARPSAERRLFTNVDRTISPTWFAGLEQTISSTGLRSGEWQTLSGSTTSSRQMLLNVAFPDQVWNEEQQVGTILVIHRIELLNSNSSIVFASDGKNLENVPGFRVSTWPDGNPMGGPYWEESISELVGYGLFSGSFSLPLNLPVGDYFLRINASRRELPGETVTLAASLNTLDPRDNSPGQQRTREQLRALHKHLLGEWLPNDSAELDASYALFVDIWETRRTFADGDSAVFWGGNADGQESCEIYQPGWWDVPRNREFSDPQDVVGSWITMLIYFLSDFRYLHE